MGDFALHTGLDVTIMPGACDRLAHLDRLARRIWHLTARTQQRSGCTRRAAGSGPPMPAKAQRPTHNCTESWALPCARETKRRRKDDALWVRAGTAARGRALDTRRWRGQNSLARTIYADRTDIPTR